MILGLIPSQYAITANTMSALSDIAKNDALFHQFGASKEDIIKIEIDFDKCYCQFFINEYEIKNGKFEEKKDEIKDMKYVMCCSLRQKYDAIEIVEFRMT